MFFVPAGPAVSIVDSIAGPIIDFERAFAALPSRDIEIRVATGSAEEIRHLFATIIRRESYYRVVLIQSRGRTAVRYPSKCGNSNAFPKFRHCVRLPPYHNGACVKCIWQNRAA
ncbi:hypothetical protein MCOR11_003794 [Pyricularia oryzae]|nr:hypothetical protein MCOR11_003794 [Pyricularia oryzae]